MGVILGYNGKENGNYYNGAAFTAILEFFPSKKKRKKMAHMS